jgi:hypothetical protein
MTTNIGKLDSIVLSKNIDAIINRINHGLTTIEKEVNNREHEISVLKAYRTLNSKTIKNNKIRIAYIEMEIDVLNRLIL